MAQEPQLGRAAGADRFPNKSNPLLGFADPSGSPDPKYTMKGTGPRGGPGVPGVEPGPAPGNRTSTTSAPAVDAELDATPDRAGARLSPVTNSHASRATYLRQYLENQPAPYDPLRPRTSLGVVQASRAGSAGQDPLWAKRRASRAQDQPDVRA